MTTKDPDQKFIEFVYDWAKRQGKKFIIEDFDGRECDEPIDGMAAADV